MITIITSLVTSPDIEVWKPCDSYLISNFGKVKDALTGKDIQPYIDHHNNHLVGIYSIPRLVAIRFLKKVSGKDNVRNINGDRYNNHYTNIEYY